jgi:hypothetical protein
LCAPEMPEAPNPIKVSGLQTQSNVQTAVANAWLNNTDTQGPLGSTDYVEQGYRNIQIPAGKSGGRVRNVRVPIFKQINRLSADQQRLLDLQEQSGQNIGELAVQQSDRMQDYLGQEIDPNSLPDDVRNSARADQLLRAQSPDDFVAEKHRQEEALMARLNPQLDRDRASLETRLANQGVVSGSEAHKQAFDAFGRQSNDARMQAILSAGQEQNRLYDLEQRRVGQANEAIQGDYANTMSSDQAQQTLRQQALQEAMALRNQPLSELAQLLHGSSPTIPQFQGWDGPTVANTPIGEYFYRSAAMNQQAALAQSQQQNAMMGGAFGALGNLFMMSDRRVKEDIEKVGRLDNGLPIFSYRYKGDDTPQIGLMAQDVEKVHPEAVANFGGLKAVRYDLATQPVE